MEYKEGYLAFLDILGFSKFVMDENNAQLTSGLFEYIKRYCYLANTSQDFHAKLSFFSDTIIITANKLEELTMPIYMTELYLKDCLGLLLRGSIVRGKYYHKDGTTFGPAVVKGYELEKKAIYSRVILDNAISEERDNNFFFVDIDGYTCFNPYTALFFDTLASVSQITTKQDDIDKSLVESLLTERNYLLFQVNKYRGSTVIDKYLWRIRAFNYFCNHTENLPLDEFLYINYNFTENVKKRILQLVILESEIFNI